MGYFDTSPFGDSMDAKELRSAFNAALETAKREASARKKQEEIYSRARKDIQKTLDDARKVLGDVEFNRAMAQERLSPAELYKWSKQMERKYAALEKRCKEDGIEYLKRDTEDAARRAKENAARRNITRAKAMMASIDAATAQAAADTQINFSKTLKAEALKSARNEEKKLEYGFDLDLDSISPSRVKALTNETFHGENYTDRIRDGRDKLNLELERCLRLGQVNGWSLSKLSREMSNRVSISERAANRILRTEMTRVSNEAVLEEIKNTGARFYKYISAMDSRTCERCKELNGQTFAISKASIGENFPPLHPNCRCRIVISTDNERGEYDTSYVDDIVDRNIQNALAKWEAEGIDVFPDALLAPAGNSSSLPTSLYDLPQTAYLSKTQTRFDDSVMSLYNAGAGYNAVKSAYVADMAMRGLPSSVCALVNHVYTKRVYEEMPPVFVYFNKGKSEGGYVSTLHSVYLSCEDSDKTMFELTHELTHTLDYSIWRKRKRRDKFNYINSAFRKDAESLLKEGVRVSGNHYSIESIKAAIGSQHLISSQEYLRNFSIDILKETDIELQNPVSEYLIRLVFDSLQSLLGFEYGEGHRESYCIATAGTFVEIVAHCGISHIWGYEKIFSMLFPKGYTSVKRLFESYSIKPIRGDNV